jgi:hypothetical protein
MMEANYDPLDIDAQNTAEEDKEDRIRIQKENEEADLKWLMSSRRGRRIVWRLLDQSGVFHPVFNTNAMQMAFNEGNRNYGLKTLAMVQTYCSDLYSIMQRENVNGRGNAVRPGSRN